MRKTWKRAAALVMASAMTLGSAAAVHAEESSAGVKGRKRRRKGPDERPVPSTKMRRKQDE